MNYLDEILSCDCAFCKAFIRVFEKETNDGNPLPKRINLIEVNQPEIL